MHFAFNIFLLSLSFLSFTLCFTFKISKFHFFFDFISLSVTNFFHLYCCCGQVKHLLRAASFSLTWLFALLNCSLSFCAALAPLIHLTLSVYFSACASFYFDLCVCARLHCGQFADNSNSFQNVGIIILDFWRFINNSRGGIRLRLLIENEHSQRQ